MNQPPPALPPHPQPPVQAKNCGLAITSLVLGLSSLIFSIITGLPAVICGHIALGKIKRAQGSLSGNGMAITGLVLGYISFPLTIVAIAAALLTPLILKSQKKAEIATNSHNAKQLFLALFDYHQDFDTFPDSLDELVAKKHLSRKGLKDLQPKKGGDWQYFSGQSFDSNNKNILLASPTAIDGKWVILQIDGSVKQLKDADYQAALRAQQHP